MFAAEHTGADARLEEEEMNKQDVEVVTRLIIGQKELLTNDTELAGQMDRLLDIMQTSPMMPELFGKLNLEMALVKHDMVSVILGLFRDEFTRIKEELDTEDIEGKKLSEDLINFFSDNRTVRAFSLAGEAQVAEYLETVSDQHHEEHNHAFHQILTEGSLRTHPVHRRTNNDPLHIRTIMLTCCQQQPPIHEVETAARSTETSTNSS